MHVWYLPFPVQAVLPPCHVKCSDIFLHGATLLLHDLSLATFLSPSKAYLFMTASQILGSCLGHGLVPPAYPSILLHCLPLAPLYTDILPLCQLLWWLYM